MTTVVASVSSTGLTAGVPTTVLFIPTGSGIFQINATMLVNGILGSGGVLPLLTIGYNDGTGPQVCNPLSPGVQSSSEGRIIDVQQITCTPLAPITYNTIIQGVPAWTSYDLSFDLTQTF